MITKRLVCSLSASNGEGEKLFFFVQIGIEIFEVSARQFMTKNRRQNYGLTRNKISAI